MGQSFQMQILLMIFSLHEPPLQASFRSIPRIRIWPIGVQPDKSAVVVCNRPFSVVVLVSWPLVAVWLKVTLL